MIADVELLASYKNRELHGYKPTEKDKSLTTLYKLLDIVFNQKENDIISKFGSYYDFFVGLLTEILSVKCGCHVRKVYLKDPAAAEDQPDTEKTLLLKLKLPNPNLIYWAAKKDIKLWLNFNED